MKTTIAPDLSQKPFAEALSQARDLAEGMISHSLAGLNGSIVDAMQYAVTGGKGLRAFLAIESARLHGLGIDKSSFAAGAIEAMHAYSLIHDDLPCMDDDDLRRGQPTVHKRWDEATAVLAGDALQALSFDMAARIGCAAEHRIHLVSFLASAAGASGMVGGQGLDIAAEQAATPLTLEEIITLQRGKTGALIQWAAMVGPRMLGDPGHKLAIYSECLGLAFQIADDILDVESDAATLGKATQKDADAGKATFVSLLGLDEAKGRANSLVQEACDALECYGADAETLRDCARFVIARKN